MPDRYQRTPAMMHSIDADGRIEEVSNLWLEKLGYRREEVIGRRSVEFLTEESRRFAQNVVLPAFYATGRCDDVEYTFVCKDGTPLPVRLSGRAERDHNGTFVRSLAVLQDVRELIALERRVYESQKLESLGVLAGGVAHDFNNLLVAIIGNAELARRTEGLPAAAAEYLADLRLTAERAADMCRQLLAYSGGGRFTTEPVSLGSLCREMLDILEVTVGGRARLSLRMDADPVVLVSVTQLRQVVMNLVLNAAEAVESATGHVTLSCGIRTLSAAEAQRARFAVPPGRYAYLEVADDGEGMDAATAARIFEPFFSTKATGRGLGLAGVLGIVRSHHGTIQVRSEPGAGAVIRVSLPEHEPDPRVEAPRTPACVLLVDDEEVVRAATSRLLRAEGYETLLAHDGDEAIALVNARGGEIDIVLLDVNLPGRLGPEVLRLLRVAAPGVPIVLMSGYSEAQVRSEGSSDPDGFLEKPFERTTLIATVADLVARSGRRATPPAESK